MCINSCFSFVSSWLFLWIKLFGFTPNGIKMSWLYTHLNIVYKTPKKFFIPWSNLKGVALTDFSLLHINQPYSTIYNVKSPEALKSACSRWCTVTDNVKSAYSALQLPDQFGEHSWLKPVWFFFSACKSQNPAAFALHLVFNISYAFLKY